MSALPRLSALWGATVLAFTAVTALASDALPSVRVQYDIHRNGVAAERLEVLREADWIEYRLLDQGVTEIWRRDARGELEHWKLFSKDGKSIHYFAGDLRTLGTQPAWDDLASLIDDPTRARLATSRAVRPPRTGSVLEIEERTERQSMRVRWLSHLSLPEEIAVSDGKGLVTLKFRSVEECSGRCARTVLSAVEEIEFADVGDRERDPFIARFRAYAGMPHAQHQ